MPRFSQMKNLDEKIKTEEEDLNTVKLMDETIGRIKNLKIELEELKKQKPRLEYKSKINAPKPTERNSTVLNRESKVSDIIKKYSTKRGAEELKIFENIYKNYNETSIKNVNVEEMNEKIKRALDNKQI
jgi:hypothetical protein